MRHPKRRWRSNFWIFLLFWLSLESPMRCETATAWYWQGVSDELTSHTFHLCCWRGEYLFAQRMTTWNGAFFANMGKEGVEKKEGGELLLKRHALCFYVRLWRALRPFSMPTLGSCPPPHLSSFSSSSSLFLFFLRVYFPWNIFGRLQSFQDRHGRHIQKVSRSPTSLKKIKLVRETLATVWLIWWLFLCSNAFVKRDQSNRGVPRKEERVNWARFIHHC